jgi:hypothetical protein
MSCSLCFSLDNFHREARGLGQHSNRISGYGARWWARVDAAHRDLKSCRNSDKFHLDFGSTQFVLLQMLVSTERMRVSRHLLLDGDAEIGGLVRGSRLTSVIGAVAGRFRCNVRRSLDLRRYVN